ncbi:hypothetical protein AGABI1DRAFT_129346 [Agaricus bisporus var. burnettii JB137-S8]|uniref:Uncharacterized protein n=1 Tax=Agaricus bisporus var. burnettii (strain JB137-S8 / ATCC MYA-4627 / FGSC 10392) TaxID=597362 RepID=K5XT87_AGABU|nr:uncharacterized protein AGABI1DRAFT_129346 [Agaricus bisporus var. burnettii JB137-S8]EKM78220.1 hypothetical protein AGABI1DRAFT_129346 [Agaricus bisporus var. burnettii JB137-S8]
MLDNFLTSLDEWDEILSYLEVSLEDDDEKVVKEKRKAISAIALLSPKLTELALNALWKNMTTLVPIVEVVNSDGEFFDYHRVLNGRGCWRVSADLEITEKFLDDLIRNLKRIRNLRVQVSEKELELWQMLHAFLIPRSMVYILPCLQGLSLVSANSPQSHPFLGIISYIFAPSLTTITVSGCWGASWMTVQHHMNSHHLPNLYRLRYLDDTLEHYPCGIERFTSLRCLVIHDEEQFYNLSTLVDLAPLNYLRKLAISIQVDDDDFEDPSTLSIMLPELQHLQLKIGSEDTYDLFFRVQLPSLISLSLEMQHTLEQELPLGFIVASYPNLCDLILHCTEMEDHSYIMSANDFMTIALVRGMKSLKLINIPHKLKERDIFSLVKSLPNLHSLTVTGPGTIFSVALIISISQFSNLRCVELPLDFSLLADHWSSEKMSQSPSQMRKLISPNSSGIPDKSSAKLVLIRNVLHLFPKLEEFGGTGGPLEELRDLFQVANNMFIH